MEWIFFTLAAVVIIALAMGKVRRTSPGKQTVPVQFDFNRVKAGELSRRGLHDRTKRE